jgi:hypothetical protein
MDSSEITAMLDCLEAGWLTAIDQAWWAGFWYGVGIGLAGLFVVFEFWLLGRRKKSCS